MQSLVEDKLDEEGKALTIVKVEGPKNGKFTVTAHSNGNPTTIIVRNYDSKTANTLYKVTIDNKEHWVQKGLTIKGLKSNAYLDTTNGAVAGANQGANPTTDALTGFTPVTSSGTTTYTATVGALDGDKVITQALLLQLKEKGASAGHVTTAGDVQVYGKDGWENVPTSGAYVVPGTRLQYNLDWSDTTADTYSAVYLPGDIANAIVFPQERVTTTVYKGELTAVADSSTVNTCTVTFVIDLCAVDAGTDVTITPVASGTTTWTTNGLTLYAAGTQLQFKLPADVKHYMVDADSATSEVDASHSDPDYCMFSVTASDAEDGVITLVPAVKIDSTNNGTPPLYYYTDLDDLKADCTAAFGGTTTFANKLNNGVDTTFLPADSTVYVVTDKMNATLKIAQNKTVPVFNALTDINSHVGTNLTGYPAYELKLSKGSSDLEQTTFELDGQLDIHGDHGSSGMNNITVSPLALTLKRDGTNKIIDASGNCTLKLIATPNDTLEFDDEITVKDATTNKEAVLKITEDHSTTGICTLTFALKAGSGVLDSDNYTGTLSLKLTTAAGKVITIDDITIKIVA